MLHVRLDAYFTHFGMNHETEVEAVVIGYVGGVGHFSFFEKRKFQDYFFDLGIEFTILYFACNDDFTLCDMRWFLLCIASEEQKQGKDEDG